jgi:hypothetical protein
VRNPWREPGYRSSPDAAIVIGLTLLITAAPLLSSSAALVASIGVVFLTVLAWVKRGPAAAPVGVFCVACLVLALSGIQYSQVVLGVGLLVYAVVVRQVAYGLMMGVVRRRAGGMFAPWAAHVLTDVVIVGIVLAVARPDLPLHETAARLPLNPSSP